MMTPILIKLDDGRVLDATEGIAVIAKDMARGAIDIDIDALMQAQFAGLAGLGVVSAETAKRLCFVAAALFTLQCEQEMLNESDMAASELAALRDGGGLQ